jgi:FMN-dependent NADH-azoreductase
VQHLDVGRHPPPAIDESWIAAAYTPAAQRTPEMHAALAASDRYVDQLLAADAIAIGAPLYNFGMPAQLKAYIEQIVRVGRTFAFNRDGNDPYLGLVGNKPALVITSSGASRVVPTSSGPETSYLEPQLLTILELMGIRDVTLVAFRGQQEDSAHIARALATAECEIDKWLPAAVGDSIAQKPQLAGVTIAEESP